MLAWPELINMEQASKNMFQMNPEALEQEIKDGCTYILCGVDLSILSDSFKIISDKLQNIRKVI